MYVPPTHTYITLDAHASCMHAWMAAMHAIHPSIHTHGMHACIDAYPTAHSAISDEFSRDTLNLGIEAHCRDGYRREWRRATTSTRRWASQNVPDLVSKCVRLCASRNSHTHKAYPSHEISERRLLHAQVKLLHSAPRRSRASCACCPTAPPPPRP